MNGVKNKTSSIPYNININEKLSDFINIEPYMKDIARAFIEIILRYGSIDVVFNSVKTIIGFKFRCSGCSLITHICADHSQEDLTAILDHLKINKLAAHSPKIRFAANRPALDEYLYNSGLFGGFQVIDRKFSIEIHNNISKIKKYGLDLASEENAIRILNERYKYIKACTICGLFMEMVGDRVGSIEISHLLDHKIGPKIKNNLKCCDSD